MRKFFIAVALVSVTAVPAFAAKYDANADAYSSVTLTRPGSMNTQATIPAKPPPQSGVAARASPPGAPLRDQFLQVARR